MPSTLVFSSAGGGKGAVPSVPNLSYTAEGQFTITNYDSSLTYTVSGATRSGNLLTNVSNNATITAKYQRSVPSSAARTMNVAANVRILTSVAATPGSAGCGPRGTICCPGSSIVNTDGGQCVPGPGTQGSFAECDGVCSRENCFGLFLTCWNWRWTNYSTGPDGTGYTLIGNTWGKVT
jgi:hypothetical protein